MKKVAVTMFMLLLLFSCKGFNNLNNAVDNLISVSDSLQTANDKRAVKLFKYGYLQGYLDARNDVISGDEFNEEKLDKLCDTVRVRYLLSGG